MVVGILRLTFYISGAASLKDKRQVLRKVVDRLRARFNVSVAEVGDNDVWQRAVVGICAVANDHSFVNEVLDKCARDAGNIAEIINREMEIETYSEMQSEFAMKPDLDAPDTGHRTPATGKDEPEDPPGPELAGFLTEEDFE
jgi:uncharacterized protein YlxP (DUF503 family)